MRRTAADHILLLCALVRGTHVGKKISDASSCAVSSNLTASEVRSQLPSVTLADITLPPNALGTSAAARSIFDKYGVLLVPGLAAAHAPRIRTAADAAFEHSVALLDAGHLQPVQNDAHVVGWVTPDQTLFIPAPEGHVRDKQAMVLALDYHSDAAMLQAATDAALLDVLAAATGWDNIELFGKGQTFYKEGVPKATSRGGVDGAMLGPNATRDARVGAGVQPGGNPKYMHQDSAYFMFANEGAVATLAYAVDTSAALDNGPLHVVPGSHRFGHLPHVDTPSHLGVAGDWTFDDAVRIDGSAGDVIFFHVHTLHGSPPNRSPTARPVFINRFIEAGDYQTYFATDARMRERARSEYEQSVRDGHRPQKERGIMVRGRRVWKADGPEWLLNAKVNH